MIKKKILNISSIILCVIWLVQYLIVNGWHLLPHVRYPVYEYDMGEVIDCGNNVA